MRRQKLVGLTAVAAFAGLLVGGVAVAQNKPGSPPPAAAGGLPVQVNLSPQEEVTQGEQFLTRMDSGRMGVRRQLETARSQRDVVKTLCLNDKLNQIDVAIRSARERRDALAVAASRSDTDLANHEFTILRVLRDRSDQLTAEANQCIGQEAGYVGESSVIPYVEPGIPEDPGVFLPPGAYDAVGQAPIPVSAFK